MPDDKNGAARLPGLDMEAEIRGLLRAAGADGAPQAETALDRELDALDEAGREAWLDAQWNAFLDLD